MESNGIQGQNINTVFHRVRFQRGLTFGVMIIAALLAFEIFNYSTTDYALSDLLGDLKFLGIRWATILAIAFCGIDFAGIARLFTPEQGAEEPGEVWYLFGAWLLAATMNAMLTWWGVSLALLNHETLGNAVIERGTLLRVVPIFVAILVWLIRVLVIGTFSVAGERLFSQGEQRIYPVHRPRAVATTTPPVPVRSLGNRAPAPRSNPASNPASANAFRPAPKPSNSLEPGPTRPEPTYQPVSMKGNSGSTPVGQYPPKGGPQTRR